MYLQYGSFDVTNGDIERAPLRALSNRPLHFGAISAYRDDAFSPRRHIAAGNHNVAVRDFVIHFSRDRDYLGQGPIEVDSAARALYRTELLLCRLPLAGYFPHTELARCLVTLWAFSSARTAAGASPARYQWFITHLTSTNADVGLIF